MPSAREIRAKLRRKVDDERRQQEEAVVAVGTAATAAVKARADNESALRDAFEAALRTRTDERIAKLREEFEAALADSDQVAEAELAAGRAVLAAAEFKVSQGDLAELTEQRVEDLRRWTQMARQAEAATAADSTEGGDGEPDKPEPASQSVTGYAVVATPGSAVGTDEGDGVRDLTVAAG